MHEDDITISGMSVQTHLLGDKKIRAADPKRMARTNAKSNEETRSHREGIIEKDGYRTESHRQSMMMTMLASQTGRTESLPLEPTIKLRGVVEQIQQLLAENRSQARRSVGLLGGTLT